MVDRAPARLEPFRLGHDLVRGGRFPDASAACSLTATVDLASRRPSAKGGAIDPTRKLYRSRTNRKLAGICGGLGRYFNVDATLLRVLFVLLAVLGGSGLVLYLVLWIIIPSEPQVAA
jgi:phage shock protein C